MNKNKISFTLPLVSRYSSRQKWEEACWNKILNSKGILESAITSYERHNLVMRAAVIERINSGKKYKQIAEELWLSPQTISSINKSISENNYKSYRERGKSERKKKIYSPDPVSNKPKHKGRPRRTKYGTIYLPY